MLALAGIVNMQATHEVQPCAFHEQSCSAASLLHFEPFVFDCCAHLHNPMLFVALDIWAKMHQPSRLVEQLCSGSTL